MSKDYVVMIKDDRRADIFKNILGGKAVVYVLSPEPKPVTIGRAGERFCYIIDLDLLSSKQRFRLEDYYMTEWRLKADEMYKLLRDVGAPLQAAGCQLIVQQQLFDFAGPFGTAEKRPEEVAPPADPPNPWPHAGSEWRYSLGQRARCRHCVRQFPQADPIHADWVPDEQPGIWKCPEGHRLADHFMQIVREETQPQEQPEGA
jgi:hypothetical protein